MVKQANAVRPYGLNNNPEADASGLFVQKFIYT